MALAAPGSLSGSDPDKTLRPLVALLILAGPAAAQSTDYSGVTLTSPAGDLAFDGRLGIRSDASVGNVDASSFDLTSQTGAYVITVKISPLGQATVCNKAGNILGYPQC